MHRRPAGAKPRDGGASSFATVYRRFSPKNVATGLALKFAIGA